MKTSHWLWFDLKMDGFHQVYFAQDILFMNKYLWRHMKGDGQVLSDHMTILGHSEKQYIMFYYINLTSETDVSMQIVFNPSY